MGETLNHQGFLNLAIFRVDFIHGNGWCLWWIFFHDRFLDNKLTVFSNGQMPTKNTGKNLCELFWRIYPPGNDHISPTQGMLEDDFPFPKVGIGGIC